MGRCGGPHYFQGTHQNSCLEQSAVAGVWWSLPYSRRIGIAWHVPRWWLFLLLPLTGWFGQV